MAWQGKLLASSIAALVGVGPVAPALAEPPPWAPAHGWRAKHGHQESEPVYEAPYGISQNTCYRSAVGALIGAGAGAYAGNQVGKGGGKIAATIGGGIGHWMDQADQGCVGQVLEHAQTGQAVQWTNPDNGAQYAVTAVKTYQAQGGGYCREYTAQATVAGRAQQTYGTACRQPDGSWHIVN